jgi:hypothetical protein
MNPPTLSSNRTILAFVIAGLADLVQIPLTAFMVSIVGAPVAFFFVLIINCVLTGILSLLLGFHWLLLPSFLLEQVPGIGALPTWTACVALVVKQRKDEAAAWQPPPASYAPPPSASPPQLPLALTAHTQATAQPPSLHQADIEARLSRLTDLLAKNMITQAEYEAKRQQILAEI